jgi:hypothetical protein
VRIAAAKGDLKSDRFESGHKVFDPISRVTRNAAVPIQDLHDALFQFVDLSHHALHTV